MITPPTIPANEQDRLAALRSYHIIDSTKNEEFDQLTDLATYFTDMPI